MSDVRFVAENLLEQFRAPFKVDSRDLLLTASVGIASYPDDGESSSELLRHADTAMYHAKESGRNNYSYFTGTMKDEISRRLLLEENMHGALDRGEFRLLYQPQVDLLNCNVIGVEALLQWHSPILGKVEPAEFIPIAEQTGLIISLGQFVLTEAIVMSGKLHKINDDRFKMSVNISPRQFQDSNLALFIESLMDRFNVPYHCLELEIAEEFLLSGSSHINNTIAELSKKGLSIAMDDFGTGNSSLSYLRNYPFDILKIDRSFVNDIAEDNSSMKLIKATIAMAHSLGLKIVADGVETKEQYALLAEEKCDFAQGYLFSKPTSGEEIMKMLESGRFE